MDSTEQARDSAPPARRGRLGGVWRFCLAVTQRVLAHDGLEMAGNLAFTAILSLFPFLLFLAALAGFLGDAETARKFIEFLFEFTPTDVAETLAPAVYEVLTARQGGLLTLGILGTLWAASGGVESLRVVLNRAYGAEEQRAIWWRRLQSILIVIGTSGAVLAASVTVIFGPLIWDFLDRYMAVHEGEWAWIAVRYAIAVLLLGLVLLVLHRLLPGQAQPFRHLAVGVVSTLAIWIVISSLFTLYLGTIGDYSGTYGALGGVIITLMFFYLAALAFVVGAELNGELWDKPPPRDRQQDDADRARPDRPARRDPAGRLA